MEKRFLEIGKKYYLKDKRAEDDYRANRQVSSLLNIGDCVSIGTGTVVRNPNVSDDSIVYRDDNKGAVVQKPNEKDNCFAQNYFKDTLKML